MSYTEELPRLYRCEVLEEAAWQGASYDAVTVPPSVGDLAFTDGSRMAVQLASGQTISGRFQTMLTNGDMVWFTEEAPRNGNG